MSRISTITISCLLTLLVYQYGVIRGYSKPQEPLKADLGVMVSPGPEKGLKRQETPVINLGRIEAWKLWNVSFYDNDKYCVDKQFRDSRFASGKKVYFGGIAMGKQYKFGTEIVFEKPILGRKTFICEDRGRLIKGKDKIDIYVSSHSLARELGRMRVYGRILE